MISTMKGLGRVLATYSFHPEAATPVHHLEKVVVLLAAEPAELGNLKVGPEVAHVVLFPLHRLGVNGRQAARLSLENLLGQRRVGVVALLLGRILRLHEHFPEAL